MAYQKWRKWSGANSTEENKSTSPDELIKILRRYLQESHETERTIASRIGVNRHTFGRWLSDSQSPKKRTLALAASFLRRAGYL
jgi:DNA invertase Pin-like site-specific DNA recombinase